MALSAPGSTHLHSMESKQRLNFWRQTHISARHTTKRLPRLCQHALFDTHWLLPRILPLVIYIARALTHQPHMPPVLALQAATVKPIKNSTKFHSPTNSPPHLCPPAPPSSSSRNKSPYCTSNLPTLPAAVSTLTDKVTHGPTGCVLTVLLSPSTSPGS